MSNSDLNIVCAEIEKEKEFLNDISQKLWNRPEIAFKEEFAHSILTNALLKCGFEVERNYLLPTAFRAEYSSKQDNGPVVAVLLEYDALPEIGHGCGHNLIAEAGLAAGIAIKAAIDADPLLTGKVVLLGTPAEENGGGKVEMIHRGAFEDIDVALMVHPTKYTVLAPTTLSILSCVIDFKGKESHASVAPWEGRNALDAAVSFYQSIGLLRQQMKPSHRLHAIISKGGTAPNIIPADTRVEIYIRTPTKTEINELRLKVEHCVEGAAKATGCTYTLNYDEENCYKHLISNEVLEKVFRKYSGILGLPEHGVNGTKISASFSTDMGNVSHVVPSLHPCYDIGTDAYCHTKEFTLAAGSKHAQTPTLLTAKCMALTALSIFRDENILHQVKKEFETKHK